MNDFIISPIDKKYATNKKYVIDDIIVSENVFGGGNTLVKSKQTILNDQMKQENINKLSNRGKKLYESLLKAQLFDESFEKENVLLSPFLSDSKNKIDENKIPIYKNIGKYLRIDPINNNRKIYYLCMLKLFSKDPDWLINDNELLLNAENCSKSLFKNSLVDMSIDNIYDSINTIEGNFNYYIELHNFTLRMCQFVFNDKRFEDITNNMLKIEIVKSLFEFIKFVNEYSLKITTECQQNSIITPFVILQADKNLIFLMYLTFYYYQKLLEKSNNIKIKLENIKSFINNLAQYNENKKVAMTSLLPSEKNTKTIEHTIKENNKYFVSDNKISSLKLEYDRINKQFEIYQKKVDNLEKSLNNAKNDLTDEAVAKIGKNIGKYF